MPILDGIKNPKTLKISQETMQKLKEIKIKEDCRSYDEVIKMLTDLHEIYYRGR